MTAGTASAVTDRAAFRQVLTGGAALGAATAGAVVAYLAATRFAPAGAPRSLVQALIVLGGGVAAAFWPAHRVAPRTADGIAGAAGMGLWGTVVFSALDITLLRPLDAYPWTWDAVGGMSTWWYLPLWWMLGTLLAWLGALVAAAAARRDGAGVGRVAVSAAAAGTALGAAGALVLPVLWPVAIGGGFTIALAGLGVAAAARKR